MSDWSALLVSALVAAAMMPALIGMLRRAGWVERNWRGNEVVAPAGPLALVASVIALGVLALIGSDERPLHATGVDALVLGVGLLGLLDDRAGDNGPRGLRGHLAALGRGELSTGTVKALGVIALVLAAGFVTLREVAVIALATNLFNLLDLRPGRAVKSWVLLGAILLMLTGETLALRAIGVWAGPLLVLGAWDLRERTMLGDTGANALGVLAGVWLVLALGTTAQWVALAVLLALTAYGELASFSRAIDAIGPLRALDRVGRPRA